MAPADILTRHRYCPALVRRAYVWVVNAVSRVVAQAQVRTRPADILPVCGGALACSHAYLTTHTHTQTCAQLQTNLCHNTCVTHDSPIYLSRIRIDARLYIYSRQHHSDSISGHLSSHLPLHVHPWPHIHTWPHIYANSCKRTNTTTHARKAHLPYSCPAYASIEANGLRLEAVSHATH